MQKHIHGKVLWKKLKNVDKVFHIPFRSTEWNLDMRVIGLSNANWTGVSCVYTSVLFTGF